MTTSDAIEEALQEELENWGSRFTSVADDISSDGWSLLDAPEHQIPRELLDWAMATMQNVARPLRAACEELFPLSDELRASIDKMFASSTKATPVKVDENGDSCERGGHRG